MLIRDLGCFRGVADFRCTFGEYVAVASRVSKRERREKRYEDVFRRRSVKAVAAP